MFTQESKFLLIKIISPKVRPKNTYLGHYTPHSPIHSHPAACRPAPGAPDSHFPCRSAGECLVNQMVDIIRAQF